MVSSFTKENGGTLVVPRSHRQSTNPTDPRFGVDPAAPDPQEFQVIGDAGGMLLFDSRTWHCAPANLSGQPRVSVSVRYAPWWLNLEALDPDSDRRQQWVEEPGLQENDQRRIQRETFEALPERAKPLHRHWLERPFAMPPNVD